MSTKESTEDNNNSSKDTPEKSLYILLSLLLGINAIFLLFIVSRFPEDKSTSLEEVKAEISDRRNGYEIEMHLRTYILLKMQVQKDIRDNRPSEEILVVINKAVGELESVLSMPGINSSLEQSKLDDLKNELRDMNKSRRLFSDQAE